MFRVTSHTSQGPWPCTGEGPWFSSKGHTVGSGIATLCSHMPSSTIWSENGPYWGTNVYLIGGDKGAALPHSLYVFKIFFFTYFLSFTLVRKSVMVHIGRKGGFLLHSLYIGFCLGIRLLALRTDTLFMPAPKRDRSFYLSIGFCTWLCNISLIYKHWHLMGGLMAQWWAFVAAF